MFKEYDCFRLRKALPNESLQVGTIGVILMVFDSPSRAYEVEFPDGTGGNLGTQLTSAARQS
jgi:Domain of unknown function (DUF4926)